MKLFTKTLLVTAMALAATGAAEARTQTVSNQVLDGSNGSELLFNLVNYTAETSFTLDLGVYIAQFMANPAQSLSFDMNALANNGHYQSFVSAFTAGDNVKWGVAGGHGLLNELTDLPLFGFYTTSVSAAPAIIDENASQIGISFGVWNTMVGEFNIVNDISENNSSFRTVGQSGYTADYFDDFIGALPFTAQGDLGTALAFVHEKVNADDFDTGELDVFAGQWNFNVSGANAGKLTYAAAPVSAVPVPAAVWMFGAGLMGVLRLNRRKSMAA